MDFPRSQIDILIAQGIEHNDQLYVPQKYGDPGRVNYVPRRMAPVSDHEPGWHCAASRRVV